MKQKNIYLVITFTISLCWILWNYEASLWLLEKLYKILRPFLIGICLAFIINVLTLRLEHLYQRFCLRPALLKLQRPFCLLLSLLIIAALAACAMLLVLPELRLSIKMFIHMVPAAWSKLNIFLQQKATELHIYTDDIQWLQAQFNLWYKDTLAYLQNNREVLLRQTMTATISAVDFLGNAAIGFVISIYLLLDKERLCHSLKRTVYAFCTRERSDYLAETAQTANRIFTAFVTGQITEAIILGCMYFAVLLLGAFPYALVISLLVAVLGLIPFIGTFISFLIGCFLILIAAPQKIWLFLILFIVLQRIEGDFLYPKIVGKAVGLSELWVLAAVAVGGSIGGILGMIISVPLCSLIHALVSQKVARRLAEKKLHDL